MSLVFLLVLVGVTFPLPGVQALVCQLGTAAGVWNVSDLPLSWTPKETTCTSGWGCQDTLVFIESGPKVSMVLSKGCTQAGDQEPRVTEHRMGPGLSVTSYTHVCRQGDRCNNLVTSAPLWATPRPADPGSLRCPVCLSPEVCLESTEEICPRGSTDCYDGLLRLTGGGISSNLRVQGCMTQPGCNLLNGTREVGPLSMIETCSPTQHSEPQHQSQKEKDFLTCYRGIFIQSRENLSQEPTEWTAAATETCEAGQVCQETLLLVDIGFTSTLVGSKRCSAVGAKDSQTNSIHSRPPGVLVASYSHFCASNLCNGADSSRVLLNSLPPQAAPVPGDRQCPACLQPFGSCSSDSPKMTCPRGADHCYDGYIRLSGGGLTTTMSIQGCVAQPGFLLNHTRQIGIFSVREKDDVQLPVPEPQGGGAGSLESLTWGLGLALALVLWWGTLCPSC
ncbi:CD177 antigen [Sapajus apella]|uniref:CD177 antigen n=1 Tax=Sapajus apella TaxID=9515 RepID=A0A6J3GLF3_SAPAP|nr:CD177 antigen [Sapajus apella]XP_032118725.1 CD177 antigen [Sapajus apella]